MPLKKELHIQDGRVINYDKLLIATGAKPFIPPISGVQNVQYYCLHSLEDAKTIVNRAKASKSGEATIIGGGLLGLELAKALSDRGLNSTVIEIFPYLLPRQLDPEGGEFLQHLLNKKFRFSFILNAKSNSIKQENETITIHMDDVVHKCDFLLFSAGVKPRIELAQKAGIKVNRGILVDRFMRTNFEDIYAAGDVAEVNPSKFPDNAVGIIPAALDQAKVAAMNICDQEHPYTGTTPLTTLKIAGVDLTAIGQISLEANIQQFEECDYQKDIYRKLFFKDRELQGVILIGIKQDLPKLRALVSQKAPLKEVKDEINFDSFTASN